MGRPRRVCATLPVVIDQAKRQQNRCVERAGFERVQRAQAVLSGRDRAGRLVQPARGDTSVFGEGLAPCIEAAQRECRALVAFERGFRIPHGRCHQITRRAGSGGVHRADVEGSGWQPGFGGLAVVTKCRGLIALPQNAQIPEVAEPHEGFGIALFRLAPPDCRRIGPGPRRDGLLSRVEAGVLLRVRNRAGQQQRRRDMSNAR